MLETRVARGGIGQVDRARLQDAAEALEQRRVDERHLVGLDDDGAMERVAQVLGTAWRRAVIASHHRIGELSHLGA